MRLIQDNNAVPIKVSFVEGFTKEHTVCHDWGMLVGAFTVAMLHSHLILVSEDVQSSNRMA